MPSYVDDMYYDQPEDPWDESDDQEFADNAAFNQGYATYEGIEVRVRHGLIDERKLEASDYKLDSDGNVILKTSFDKFLRDNKIIIGTLLFLGYML